MIQLTHLSDKTPGGVVGRPFSRAIDAIEPERASIPSLLVTDVVDAFFSRLGGASVPAHDPLLLCVPSMFNARVDGDATYGWMPCTSPVTRDALWKALPLSRRHTHFSLLSWQRRHPPAGVSISTHGTRSRRVALV
jgi:hypothetical protein